MKKNVFRLMCAWDDMGIPRDVPWATPSGNLSKTMPSIAQMTRILHTDVVADKETLNRFNFNVWDKLYYFPSSYNNNKVFYIKHQIIVIHLFRLLVACNIQNCLPLHLYSTS